MYAARRLILCFPQTPTTSGSSSSTIFSAKKDLTASSGTRVSVLLSPHCSAVFMLILRTVGWPSAGLRFAPHIDTDLMLAKLQNASAESKGGFQVFTHDTMPERWHFGGHEVSCYSLNA